MVCRCKTQQRISIYVTTKQFTKTKIKSELCLHYNEKADSFTDGVPVELQLPFGAPITSAGGIAGKGGEGKALVNKGRKIKR